MSAIICYGRMTGVNEGKISGEIVWRSVPVRAAESRRSRRSASRATLTAHSIKQAGYS